MENILVPTSHAPEASAERFKGMTIYGLAWKREDIIILDSQKGMCEDSEVRTRKWYRMVLQPLPQRSWGTDVINLSGTNQVFAFETQINHSDCEGPHYKD